jgi:hypothetical protein
MTNNRIIKLIWAVVLAMANMVPAAMAKVIIFLDLRHDDISLRDTCLPPDQLDQRQQIVNRLERVLMNGMESKVEMTRLFGESFQPDPEKLARPIGGPWMVGPENLPNEDLIQLTENSKYFHVGDHAALYVHFGIDGRAYKPPVLFFVVDGDFTPLVQANNVASRLEWEKRIFSKICDEYHIPESEIAVR